MKEGAAPDIGLGVRKLITAIFGAPGAKWDFTQVLRSDDFGVESGCVRAGGARPRASAAWRHACLRTCALRRLIHSSTDRLSESPLLAAAPRPLATCFSGSGAVLASASALAAAALCLRMS